MEQVKVTLKTTQDLGGGTTSRNIVVNGIVCGTVERSLDFVKRSETDRIRTKWASCNDIEFDVAAMEKALNLPMEIIRATNHLYSRFNLRDADVRFTVTNTIYLVLRDAKKLMDTVGETFAKNNRPA